MSARRLSILGRLLTDTPLGNNLSLFRCTGLSKEKPMNVLDVARRECAAAGLASSDKQTILHEVAKLAAASSALSGVSVDDIEKGLREREDIGTTGFGKGIAIPHCRLDGATQFVVGVVSVPDGVDFDSLDGENVRLLVFIIGPAQESSDHIRVLSSVSRVLSSRDAVDEMVSVGSDEALYESFVRHLTDEPRAAKGDRKSLFQVFVQDEELFREILEIFGATEPRFTAVLEAENASTYLAKIPLFAGLWNDSSRTFSRVIVSLVRKRMTNEIVRRIESVTGPLSKSDRVLVVVQDTFFSGGSLTT